jgi:phage terminase small subunit
MARGKAHGNEGREKPLTATQAEFCLEYESNGRNAARAYLKTHPGASLATAYVQGCRCLRNPKIIRTLEQLRADRVKRLNMDADEAAMLTHITARADIRLAFGADGKMLPPEQWPDEFAKAVKSIRADGSIVMHDATKARELVLQMAGKLVQKVDVNHFDHIGYLAGKTRELREAEHGKGNEAGRDDQKRAGKSAAR